MNKNVIIKTKKFYFVGNRGVNSICLKLTIEILQYRLENKGVKLKREKRDYLSILIAGIFMLLSSIGVLASPNFTIKSDSAILMDAETGQVLFEKNMNKIEYPASITKVMTGLLALENSNLDDIITMTHEGVFSIERDSSHIALNVGEQISMRDALYALAIQSANDAANGIGIHISGSLEEFAKLMNKRAKELGALNTHFVTTNGLHDSQHYTTAYDMALFNKLYKHLILWTFSIKKVMIFLQLICKMILDIFIIKMGSLMENVIIMGLLPVKLGGQHRLSIR